MLIIGSILLLIANACTLSSENSNLFNRVAILILLYSGILAYDSLAIGSLDTGIGVFSGLFHSTAITHSFDIFIGIIVCCTIVNLILYNNYIKTMNFKSQSFTLALLLMSIGYLFKVSAARAIALLASKFSSFLVILGFSVASKAIARVYW